jgi:DNA-binding MarR family transcriptional regulator
MPSTKAPAANDATEMSLLADELLTAMASIRRSGRLVAGRPVELSALTGSQVDLVRLVLRRPGVSVTEAAEELGLAANTVSTLVRQLIDAGLLIRRADASDRRVARLELTPAMRRKVRAFRDRRVAMLSAAMAQLSPGEQRRLAGAVDVLGRLAARLPDQNAADG